MNSKCAWFAASLMLGFCLRSSVHARQAAGTVMAGANYSSRFASPRDRRGITAWLSDDEVVPPNPDSWMISWPVRKISVNSHRAFETVVGRAFCYVLKIVALTQGAQM